MIQLPKILPVTSHTDFVGIGSTFVAVQGMKQNGISYIPLALERGAATIVVEHEMEVPHEIMLRLQEKKIPLVRVDNARKALAQLSAQAFGYPARTLKILAVTGTKGKTSTAFMLEHVLRSSGFKMALLSTVYNKILNQQFATQLTTQHPDYIHMFLRECVKAGVDYVVLEAAAQAHTLHRLHGIEFDGFIFTNFDQEHAEFYATMDDYFHAKVSLLEQTKPSAPRLLNEKLPHSLNNKQAYSFGKTLTSDYHFTLITHSSSGISCKFTYKDMNVTTKLGLVGEFNAYNTLGVFGLAHQLGIDTADIIKALNTFERVPGRLERYTMPNGARCYIDYAHNPSSIQSVLSTLRNLTPHLIVVTGAGGDRDKTKRPLMAALAASLADYVIFTSDNPRSEDPQAIIDDMLKGVAQENYSKCAIELDREWAIKQAYACCQPDSIIALLGKGPDHYQQIGDTKFYFNESEIIQNL